MEKKLDKELKKIQRLEKSQSFCLGYIIRFGKWFLYLLPLILILFTTLALLEFIDLLDFSLIGLSIKGAFYIIAFLYGVNSIFLLIGGTQTNIVLKKRLSYERKKGHPIDSLNGFKLLIHNVKAVIKFLNVTAVLCLVAMILYVIMLSSGILEIGYVAIGFTLFGLGLILFIRSLNLKISDINGLQDFYEPDIHQIFLDNFFADIFSNHLDPVSYLKWDEYKMVITEVLNPALVERVEKMERGEKPITFAIERMLYLYYLLYEKVISDETFSQELGEVLNLNSERFDSERGAFIEGKWYFGKKDIYKLFKFIETFNPGFFDVIDRLQIELKDNIETVSTGKVYIDCSTQEIVYKTHTLNIMVFLFNNRSKSKKYNIRIIAPGFDPDQVLLKIKVEGRGSFKVPDQDIPLLSPTKIDIVNVLSDMLENGDTAWVSLTPRVIGKQTIQIFLESPKGEIIQGETRVVEVATNIKSYLRKFTSLGSIFGGLAAPLSRMLFIV
ncbi:MAG: hypothetical protein GF383_05745 [Candidatus Lokiarchaeota archaeon]|nr:hypothetical protein [Candidatus Lokiarchaeota archaeon]MBD3339434.1 hypothetical protein [Candidatus Lokiarchaeota archaeon]